MTTKKKIEELAATMKKRNSDLHEIVQEIISRVRAGEKSSPEVRALRRKAQEIRLNQPEVVICDGFGFSEKEEGK